MTSDPLLDQLYAAARTTAEKRVLDELCARAGVPTGRPLHRTPQSAPLRQVVEHLDYADLLECGHRAQREMRHVWSNKRRCTQCETDLIRGG